ncbi:hypothetical protein ACFC0M_09010, partial [Streptomyces sp. NPDC056149]
LHVGDHITVLPSGHTSTIKAIDALGTTVQTAWAPQSVTLHLTDNLDISRGDLITPTTNTPTLTQDIHATVCHLADQPLTIGQRVLLKHTTRTVKALITHIPSRLTLNDLSPHPTPHHLTANDIGTLHLRTAQPLPLDPYTHSRRTGSFLLIDPTDGTTLTAGMTGTAFTTTPPTPETAAPDATS